MEKRDKTSTHPVLRCREDTEQACSLQFIAEQPLLIRIQGWPYSVVMRTPGEEVPHAAGLCFGEGIVDSPDDFKTIAYDEHLDPNLIDIRLTPGKDETFPDLFRYRDFLSPTGRGVCEKIGNLDQNMSPIKNGFVVEIGFVFECIRELSESQSHYQTTRGSHAALLFDDRLQPIAFAEDVGRHNALDKAIGKVFLDRKLSRARILVLSSRVSHELAQKAARARLPVIISQSRPTSLAVEMAKALNLTLAFSDRSSELVIVCGENRIDRGRR